MILSLINYVMACKKRDAGIITKIISAGASLTLKFSPQRKEKLEQMAKCQKEMSHQNGDVQKNASSQTKLSGAAKLLVGSNYNNAKNCSAHENRKMAA